MSGKRSIFKGTSTNLTIKKGFISLTLGYDRINKHSIFMMSKSNTINIICKTQAKSFR